MKAEALRKAFLPAIAAGKAGGRPRARRGLVLLATAAAIAIVGLGIQLLPNGSDAAATSRSEHAAQRTKEEVAVRFRQAVIMLHAKQYEHAATALHRLLELAPQMPEAHANMGYAMLGLHRNEAARDFFRSAIALRAGQANAYYGLALSLAELGNTKEAGAAMRSYLSLTPPGDPFFKKGSALLASWSGG